MAEYHGALVLGIAAIGKEIATGRFPRLEVKKANCRTRCLYVYIIPCRLLKLNMYLRTNTYVCDWLERGLEDAYETC